MVNADVCDASIEQMALKVVGGRIGKTTEGDSDWPPGPERASYFREPCNGVWPQVEGVDREGGIERRIIERKVTHSAVAQLNATRLRGNADLLLSMCEFPQCAFT